MYKQEKTTLSFEKWDFGIQAHGTFD